MKRGRNGTGTVRQKPSGKWEARFYDPTGKQRSRTFARKTDADRFLRQMHAKMDAGDWTDPKAAEVRYRQLTDRWRDTWLDLKPSTIHRYEGILKKHLLPEFGDLPLRHVTHDRIQRWVTTRHRDGMNAATIERVFTVLTGSLNYAVRMRMLPESPARGVVLPEVHRREMLALTAEQVMALADAVPEHYRAVILTAAYTGCRFGELAGLKVGRLDLMRGQLNVVETLTDVDGDLTWGTTKNRQQRKVSLPPFLRDVLVDHIARFVADPTDRDELVFRAASGRPIRAAGMHKPFKRAVREALSEELHTFRFHDLRHTHASLLVAQGVHPLAISRRLGHASISITMDTYSHLLPSVEDEVTAGLQSAFTTSRQQPDEESAAG